MHIILCIMKNDVVKIITHTFSVLILLFINLLLNYNNCYAITDFASIETNVALTTLNGTYDTKTLPPTNYSQITTQTINITSANLTSTNVTTNAETNAATVIADPCHPFSALRCPTLCDPSCKRPLSKRSSCKSEHNCPQPIACPKKTCVCNPEFVLDDDEKCVRRETCSNKCPADEIYKLCPSACEIHCGNINENNPPDKCLEDEREDHVCIAACVCPTGLVRDYFTKRCIQKNLCSSASLTACPSNMDYLKCGPCEKVCNLTMEETKIRQNCSHSECKVGCFCKKGYLRANVNGKCISEEECLTLVSEKQKINEPNITNLNLLQQNYNETEYKNISDKAKH